MTLIEVIDGQRPSPAFPMATTHCQKVGPSREIVAKGLFAQMREQPGSARLYGIAC